MATPPRIGYIGFGEVGYHHARGLSQDGIRNIVAFVDGPRHRPPYAASFRRHAAQAGARLVDTIAALSAESDIVFSAVTTDSAVEAAQRAAPFLSAPQMYVDLNSCAPDRKAAAAAPVLQAGAQFIDAALMGAVVYGGHRQPLYVSGPAAASFAERMAPYNLAAVVVDERIGTASVLKMIRSVGTKGYSALLWEVGMAARRAGIDLERFGDIVWPLRLGSGNTFDTAADYFIVQGAQHLARRAKEMGDSLATMTGLGIDAVMTSTTRQVLERLGELDLQRTAAGGTAGGSALFDAALAATDARDPGRGGALHGRPL